MIDQNLANDFYDTKNKINELTAELLALNDLLYDLIEKLEEPITQKGALIFIIKRMTELFQNISNLSNDLTELKQIFYNDLH
jgi:hypothetical protein